MKNIINISDLKDIRNKILNGDFVPVYFDNVILGVKFEKLLFEKGIRWPGHEQYEEFYSIVQKVIPSSDRIILDINYSGKGVITKSHNFSNTVHKDRNSIIIGTKFLVDNIFKELPSYKPKKIERII